MYSAPKAHHHTFYSGFQVQHIYTFDTIPFHQFDTKRESVCAMSYGFLYHFAYIQNTLYICIYVHIYTERSEYITLHRLSLHIITAYRSIGPRCTSRGCCKFENCILCEKPSMYTSFKRSVYW